MQIRPKIALHNYSGDLNNKHPSNGNIWKVDFNYSDAKFQGRKIVDELSAIQFTIRITD